jgi:hypothetical protein
VTATRSGPVATPAGSDEVSVLANGLVRWFETTEGGDELFTDDVFVDYSSPLWRRQAGNRADAVALRLSGHPGVGHVPRSRIDITGTGFVLEFEETWDDNGTPWYAREMVRCDIRDGRIAEIAVYCTGDWSAARIAEHRRSEHLIRP